MGLHGFGSFGLIRLKFLATFNLHSAVDDTIGCQGFEALHFHYNQLKSNKTAAFKA